MDTNTLFTMALGLQAPWEVKDLQFDKEGQRLDIVVDFKRGANFPCPTCGLSCKVHDTEEKTFRHMDFFQHSAYLTARVPRCKCDQDGVKMVAVPWARPGSGFTLLFEAWLMLLLKAMPVASVADLVGEHDTRLWRLLHHHVDEGRAGVDMSTLKPAWTCRRRSLRGKARFGVGAGRPNGPVQPSIRFAERPPGTPRTDPPTGPTPGLLAASRA